MKRNCRIALVLLSCVFFWISPGLINAEGIGKIPRRVFFGFVSGRVKDEVRKERLFYLLPDFLYTEVSSFKPIVRVGDRKKADSLVLVDIRELEVKSENATRVGKPVEVKVVLIDRNRVVLSRVGRFNMGEVDIEKFTGFVNEVSKAIAPFMRLVKPRVRVVKSVREEKVKKVVKRIEYADKLAKEFEFTLWASGLTRLSQITPYAFTSNEPIDRFSYIFPLVFDIGWYYQKNSGLLFSFYFDSNNDMSFGLVYDVIYRSDGTIDDVRRIGVSRSENEIYLGGIGYTYRSLDMISAEFNIVQYFGGVRVKAIDPIAVYYWDLNQHSVRRGLSVAAGEIGWIFYSLLSLQSVLCVNPLPMLSLKLKFALNVNPALLINPNLDSHYYSLDFSSIFFNFFQLGIALRI